MAVRIVVLIPLLVLAVALFALLMSRKTRVGSLIVLSVVGGIATVILLVGWMAVPVAPVAPPRPAAVDWAPFIDRPQFTAESSRNLSRYLKEVARDPDNAEAQSKLGQALADHRRFDEAQAHYQKALQLKPDFVAAYVGMGGTYNCAARNDPREATRFYQMALKLDPACSDAHRGLAAVLVTQGKFDEAIAEYRKALELEPDDAQTRRSLDDLVQKQGLKKKPVGESKSDTKKVTETAAAPPPAAAAAAPPPAAAAPAKAAAAPPAAKVADAPAAEKQAPPSASAKPADDGPRSNARPAWVDAPPQLVDDVYQMAVSVGPYSTPLECETKLPDAIRNAVNEYAEIALGAEWTGRRWAADRDFCRHLIKERFEELKQYSVGPMTQLYVLLQFDRKAREQIAAAYREGLIERRVWYAVAGMAGVLALLAILYGGLKVTAPRAAKSA